MKLKHLTIALTLLIGLNTTAQNEFKLGAKLGANYSGFHVDGSSAYTDAFGYHLGLIGEYKLSNSFSLQPEMIFIQKTGRIGTPSDFAGGLITSDFNYIDIPFIVKYYFANGFAVEFGLQLDILVNEKTEVDFYDNNQTNNSVEIETNGLQFSINLGISYKIIDKYLLQFRYSHGLSDVYKDLNAKNSVFAFSVGYFFL
jgi:hypothetical protein